MQGSSWVFGAGVVVWMVGSFLGSDFSYAKPRAVSAPDIRRESWCDRLLKESEPKRHSVGDCEGCESRMRGGMEPPSEVSKVEEVVHAQAFSIGRLEKIWADWKDVPKPAKSIKTILEHLRGYLEFPARLESDGERRSLVYLVSRLTDLAGVQGKKSSLGSKDRERVELVLEKLFSLARNSSAELAGCLKPQMGDFYSFSTPGADLKVEPRGVEGFSVYERMEIQMPGDLIDRGQNTFLIFSHEDHRTIKERYEDWKLETSKADSPENKKAFLTDLIQKVSEKIPGCGDEEACKNKARVLLYHLTQANLNRAISEVTPRLMAGGGAAFQFIDTTATLDLSSGTPKVWNMARVKLGGEEISGTFFRSELECDGSKSVEQCMTAHYSYSVRAKSELKKLEKRHLTF